MADAPTTWVEPIILTGERVRLAPMELSHVPGLYEAAQFPEIWTWLPLPMPKSQEEMASRVEAALQLRAEGTEMPFVVFDRESERIVGTTRLLDISAANRHLEIGWTWYTPAVWRTRVNTECKYLLLRHAFETLGVVRVQLKTDLRNLRSQAAIERIGGIREGVLRRQRILHDGYIRDTVYFSILDREWPDVKARLEDYLR